ncbi:hypothetical protein DY000_02053919 [Brassica cretica]|uniref:Uncharacterized protein n=1 Tax=Brassica cretica TaxID=69181 RepID=A0ABQ7AI00_BRACR|nr:hypothetical protein DY000_02053919 [Brassica cretica]
MSYAGASPWSLCGRVIQMESVVALNHLTDKKQRSTTKGLLAISKNSGGSNKAAAHEEEGNIPFPKRVEKLRKCGFGQVFVGRRVHPEREHSISPTTKEDTDLPETSRCKSPDVRGVACLAHNFTKKYIVLVSHQGMSTVLEISVVDGAAANRVMFSISVSRNKGCFQGGDVKLRRSPRWLTEP